MHAFSYIDSFTIESRIMTIIVMAARIVRAESARARNPRGAESAQMLSG